MRVQEGRQARSPLGSASAPPPAGSPGGPAGAPARAGRVPDAIVLAGGLLCLVTGLTVMAAWYARATAIVRLASHGTTLFNTALALAVTGGALVALARGRPRAVLVAGVLDAVLGILVLAEYRLGRSLGIDQLFARAYISEPDSAPGRLAFNTAVCFAVLGAGLLVWSPWRARRRPIALAVAGSLIGAVAVAALIGYASGTPAAYIWTHATAMAPLTAAVLLILAVVLLSAAWGDRPAHEGGLPRWLPLPAGTLAFAVGGGVSMAVSRVGDRAGLSATGSSAGTSIILAALLAALVALAVWLAQRADRGRRFAVAAAMRGSLAEAAARASESRLLQFLDAMPVGVFVESAGGGPGYVNHEAEVMTARGIAPDPGQLSEAHRAVVAGTSRPYPAESLPAARAFRGQSSHLEDYAIRRPDGAVVSLEIWGSPVYGDTGEVKYAISAVADMSERDAREKTATDQAALLDLAHDAIVVRDRDGRIGYWNAGAEQTYGFSRAEALGRFAHELLGTRFSEPLAAIEAAATASGWEGELVQVCADGRSIVVESRWVGQRGPDGSVSFMETNRDITSRNDAEREALRTAAEIRTLNAGLEQQVRQRTVYLERANKNLASLNYSVAHDLRTPLRGISGFAEALTEEYGDRIGETGRGYADRIQLASAHMARVLDDLLYLSRVSQAQMNLRDVDLSAEATAICDRLRAADPDRRVEVSVEAGIRVTADRRLIVSVLDNLLRNAWKFSAGRHDAVIEFGTATTVDGRLSYYVRDNGVGFDDAYVDKLFQPFQRLHPGGEFAGNGIGLAAVRRVIERHGGCTWADGAVGRGATFSFTLAAATV